MSAWVQLITFSFSLCKGCRMLHGNDFESCNKLKALGPNLRHWGTATWLSLLISWLISEAHGKAARLQRPSLWRGQRGRWGWSNAPWNYVGCRKIDMNSGSIDCESICFTLCTHIQIWNGHCGFYLGPVHSQTDQSSSIFCIQILEVTWLSTVWIKESRSLIFPIFGARKYPKEIARSYPIGIAMLWVGQNWKPPKPLISPES